MSKINIPKKKGQVTFTIKALTLILSIIAFVMIVWQAQNFFGRTVQSKQKSQFKMSAMNTLQKLINDEDCLAYSYKNTTQKGVIDKKKLENFEKNYKGVEPKCARALPFDYNVRVKTLPINISIRKGRGGRGGIFDSIKSHINGKKIIFVIDGSGSMNRGIPSKIKGVNQKIDCVREPFLKGFVERLSNKSEIAIIRYSGKEGCSTPVRVPSSGKGFVKLEGNRGRIKGKIDSLFSRGYGGTPMCIGLERAFEHSKGFKDVVIVLLTDGNENTCCQGSKTTPSVAQKYKNLGVKVYSVGFGAGAVMPPLEIAASKTNGESYSARTCKQLVKKIPKKKIKTVERNWSFGVGESTGIGVKQFSTGESRESSLTLSLPVSVRYGPRDYRRGIIYLKAVKGKLERLSGYINRACYLASRTSEDVKFSLKLSLNNPVKFENGKEPKICMLGAEKTCKVLDCDKDIYFEDIEQGGEYLIRIRYDKKDDRVEVET